MRRNLTITLMLLVGLLAGCGPGESPVIPTVAQLPTVTPAPPTALPAPTELPAATEAPAPTKPAATATDSALTTALDDPFLTATPAEEAEETAPAPDTTSPTPDALPTTPPAEPVACSAGALEALLLELDTDELKAGQEGYMARLREAAAEVGDWTLADAPDPLAGTSSADALPLGSLRYQQAGQELMVLVSAMIPEVQAYYRECITEEAYVRQGDVSATAEVTLETRDLGEQAVQVTVAEPALAEDGTPTGEMLTTTTLYLVLTEDALLQVMIIPALDE
ncbi:MAG: hypothetical protein JXN59_07315, partial [Anaerolineae bacterium]|nr:hypothetical protein [Anaerolineae bacterium]